VTPAPRRSGALLVVYVEDLLTAIGDAVPRDQIALAHEGLLEFGLAAPLLARRAQNVRAPVRLV
jgi:hypothetical protein